DLDLHYQAGSSAAGTVDLTILLDPDANPWNGNEIEIDAGTVARTGTAAVAFMEVPVATGATPPGTYRVAARIADGIRERVLAAAGTLEISATSPPPEIDPATVRIEGGLMRFTVLGSPGQTVRVMAATDLEDWQEVATMTLGAETWEFSDPATASFPARFYRVDEAP
ncbi:hypothetical protein, partial [Luteolibacter marinus]|uniref:hypothetical protein n=1 Tax=Luteolibacter marinus TaxID=2776705 RepID=UPI0018673DE7